MLKDFVIEQRKPGVITLGKAAALPGLSSSDLLVLLSTPGAPFALSARRISVRSARGNQGGGQVRGQDLGINPVPWP